MFFIGLGEPVQSIYPSCADSRRMPGTGRYAAKCLVLPHPVDGNGNFVDGFVKFNWTDNVPMFYFDEPYVKVEIKNGKAEYLMWDTGGLVSHKEVQGTLEYRFGAPTFRKTFKLPATVGGVSGQVTGYLSRWDFSDLEVVYMSVMTGPDRGLVTLTTPAGQAAH
jgi:hypothetical protein